MIMIIINNAKPFYKKMLLIDIKQAFKDISTEKQYLSVLIIKNTVRKNEQNLKMTFLAYVYLLNVSASYTREQ